MKKILIIMVAILCVMTACSYDAPEITNNGEGNIDTYGIRPAIDFWIPYSEFVDAMESGEMVIREGFENSSIENIGPYNKAYPKELFEYTFIPLDLLLPGVDDIECEVQIFPQDEIYCYDVFTKNEDGDRLTVFFLQVQKANKLFSKHFTTDTVKCDSFSLDALRNNKGIHTEGTANNVLYKRMYQNIAYGEKEEITQSDVFHSAYFIYNDVTYKTTVSKEGSRLFGENIFMIKDSDKYIDTVTSYIFERNSKNISTEPITYDKNKSFDEILVEITGNDIL